MWGKHFFFLLHYTTKYSILQTDVKQECPPQV